MAEIVMVLYISIVLGKLTTLKRLDYTHKCNIYFEILNQSYYY